MNLGRLTLLIAAVATTGALIASYCAEAASGYDLVPLPATLLMWLITLLIWQGFMAAHCVATLNHHVDRRVLELLAAIRAVDADGEEGERARKTIDAHLAALRDIGTPTPGNGYLGLVK